MAFTADYDVLFDRLDEELRIAVEATPDLFAKIIASVCSRIPVLTKSGTAAGLGRLIESAAWTDSALAVVELELPMWKVRRLVYESGEWFCSLSRQPNLPVEFDDSVDACHDVLALAILRAFVEARRRTSFGHQTSGNAYHGSFRPRQLAQSVATTLPEPAPGFTRCLRSYTAFMRKAAAPSRIHMWPSAN